jgi:DNA-binding MarR family transcriptional regulator
VTAEAAGQAGQAGPAETDPFPGADICTIERELRRLHARARSASVELARSVHPHLDPALYALLVDIAEAGELRAADLVEARGVTKSAVSRQVRALERLGLLRRDCDPSDARAQTLWVTPEGRSAVRQWQAARRQYTRQLLSSCSTRQLAQIATALTRLNQLME